ncbi:protein-glycine ligase, elongating [Desmophyllum pertusum]|uniref:Protein-glycine ligase, elongating n=1 Tax=Desmophyllum pertusum TaxID=174260 RepID=A0A9X0DB58_9CNID|nr:protein-glycine ligase, elongating [Desmophyllum pertusum]
MLRFGQEMKKRLLVQDGSEEISFQIHRHLAHGNLSESLPRTFLETIKVPARKKSIFAEDQKNETEDQDAEQEAEEIDSQANDDDDEEKVSGSLSVDSGSRKDSRRQSKAATTSQYTQRNFHNLDECVSWLLSKINVDLETEFSDTSNNSASELELGSPQWIEAASSNNQDKDLTEQIVENPFANQRTVESLRSTELERNCQCPQCCHIEVNCVHQDSYNSAQDQDEDKFGSLEDSKELTSSLECFDFVYSDMNTSEVVSINQCPNNSNGSGRSQSRRSVSPSKAAKNGKDSGSGSSSGNGRGNEHDKNSNSKDTPRRNLRGGARSVSLLTGKQPSFFIGGGNGNWMIESTLVSLGWSKIEDKMDESFKMKWVECKGQINYDSFRDGEQLVNHISNINLLTTKLGLLCSLQEYQRVQEKMAKTKLKFPLSEFVPETYKLMNTTEKVKFVNDVYKDGEIWICKPTGMNQGKGIYLVNSREQLTEKLNINGGDDANSRRSQVRPPQGRVIQRYVMNPLLLNGCKFDIRTYMLIASTTPYIVFYHPGYVRMSCVPYTPYTQDATGLHAHLTNQYVQKKHPMYSSMKEDTVWSFERLQSYIDEKYAKDKELPANWVYTTFTKRMHQIMTTCFHSVRQKLHRRTGTFDLLGFDFLIDEDFKVWLLEVNINPALHTNCQVLMDLLPGVVDETLKLVIEISDKTKRKRPLFPLENQKGFQLLYNGEGK